MRRVLALFNGLPATGRTWWPERGGWGDAEHLAASNVEWTHAVFRAVLASIPQAKGRSRKLPDPLVIPRPGAKPKRKKSWIAEWASKMRG